jgi:hypothetical protein
VETKVRRLGGANRAQDAVAAVRPRSSGYRSRWRRATELTEKAAVAGSGEFLEIISGRIGSNR